MSTGDVLELPPEVLEELEILRQRVKELEDIVERLPTASDGGKVMVGQVAYVSGLARTVEQINWNAGSPTGILVYLRDSNNMQTTRYLSQLTTVKPRPVMAPPRAPAAELRDAPPGYVVYAAFKRLGGSDLYWRVLRHPDGIPDLIQFFKPSGENAWKRSVISDLVELKAKVSNGNAIEISISELPN